MTITTPEDRSVRPNTDGVKTLHSPAVERRLNQVDKIRANGIGDHIALPQLVVCGAQSSGKSSVLEGITGIPFPRQDGVCTKFATEIILRHTQDGISDSIIASIFPHKGRDEAKAEELRKFHRRLHGYDELPDVINDAARLMGIRGFGEAGDDAPGFAADVLRIEVTGYVGLHLTIVDVPGLISVDDRDGSEIQLVGQLVDSYLQSSRTIILAVVQATNDIVTEPIIQRAQQFDRSGERTVGIVTKTDLINKGTEARLAELTDADRTMLKHGFFLLKNPSPELLDNSITSLEREKDEMNFFRSQGWKKQRIDQKRVGIGALRAFLQCLLEEHIERELPKVCDEIRSLLHRTQSGLNNLGEERTTIGDQRVFLSRLGTQFLNIIQAALDGTYQDSASGFFSYRDSDLPTTRLRALIHELNTQFATYMRERSQKRRIAQKSDRHKEFDSDLNEIEVVEEDEDDNCGHLESSDGPLFLKQYEFDAWVRRVSISSFRAFLDKILTLIFFP